MHLLEFGSRLPFRTFWESLLENTLRDVKQSFERASLVPNASGENSLKRVSDAPFAATLTFYKQH